MLLPGLAAAQPAERLRGPSDYRESAAVLARYPAVPGVHLDSPAFEAARVELVDSRDIRPVDVRSRPRGYLVLRGGDAVAERLSLNEVHSCAVVGARSVAVEGYDVMRRPSKTGREAINPDQSVHVRLKAETIDVPAGALFVPTAQPAAGIVASALEPDSPGSYVGVGVIPMAADETEAPVYRLMPGAAPMIGCRP